MPKIRLEMLKAHIKSMGKQAGWSEEMLIDFLVEFCHNNGEEVGGQLMLFLNLEIDDRAEEDQIEFELS